MEVLEVETVAAAGHVFALLFRRLDADHVRAPVGEVAHARGAGAREREIDDDDTGERQVGLSGGFRNGLAHGISVLRVGGEQVCK